MQTPDNFSAAVSEVDRQLIAAAYQAFNAREMDALLATMHPDVEWPQSKEGNYMHGHPQVRAYWTQQWAKSHTLDKPVEMRRLPDGRTAVLAHQTVYDLSGNLVHEGQVLYAYTILEKLIQHMEIQSPPA